MIKKSRYQEHQVQENQGYPSSRNLINLFNRLKPVFSFVNRQKRQMELVALGVFLAGAGVLASLALSTRDNQGIEIIDSGGGEASGGRVEGETKNLAVDVAGAVLRPGVYRLAAGSRFSDALAAAGGLAVDADRDWVSRTINLAQNVTDGIKIYIPQVGGSDVGSRRSEDPTSDLKSLTSEVQISINTASLSQLDGLWGVGEARARAIIEGRPYSSVEELVSRKILPENVVERNKERLSL